MKNSVYILILLILSCNSVKEKTSNSKPSTADSTQLTNTNNVTKNDIYWVGNLNDNTPVFIQYQIDSNIIVGEITYLNTKNKEPIKLIGTIEEDKSYRLLEFEKTGNITGVITGIPNEKEFNGNWFSPKTRKELSLNLRIKDTILTSANIQPQPPEIFGNYHYQYSEAGYQGDFNLTKLNNEYASFYIFSVTGEPARNLAEIETDTIKLTGNEFIYMVPGSDSCEFKVKFYKNFVYINYTKGYCSGQFGNNATVDGIFFKKK